LITAHVSNRHVSGSARSNWETSVALSLRMYATQTGRMK
jgi:hypothetical protein